MQQAHLFHEALREMGVERPIVLGHSWGSLVALAYALEFPDEVGGLVLAAGYYFPQERAESRRSLRRRLPLWGT